MKRPFYLFAGIVAALAVALAMVLSFDTSYRTKKAVSEIIPHSAGEKPVAR